MTTITPFLWFDDQAEAAAALYVSIFDGKIVNENRWGPGAPFPEGSVMSVTFELGAANTRRSTEGRIIRSPMPSRCP